LPAHPLARRRAGRRSPTRVLAPPSRRMLGATPIHLGHGQDHHNASRHRRRSAAAARATRANARRAG